MMLHANDWNNLNTMIKHENKWKSSRGKTYKNNMYQ